MPSPYDEEDDPDIVHVIIEGPTGEMLVGLSVEQAEALAAHLVRKVQEINARNMS